MRRGLILLVSFAALAVPSVAAAHRFHGACTLSGSTTTQGPVRLAPTFGPVSFDGTGTCVGRLDGAPAARHLVKIVAEGRGDLACFTVTATGHGELRFTRNNANPADDVLLRWRWAIPIHPLGIQVYGLEGGLAHASLAFVGADKPPTACLNGSWRVFQYRAALLTLRTLRG